MTRIAFNVARLSDHRASTGPMRVGASAAPWPTRSGRGSTVAIRDRGPVSTPISTHPIGPFQ